MPKRARHRTQGEPRLSKYSQIDPDVENVVVREQEVAAWQDVQSFRRKMKQLDSILSSTLPVRADKMPIFTDKELMAASVCLDSPLLVSELKEKLASDKASLDASTEALAQEVDGSPAMAEVETEEAAAAEAEAAAAAVPPPVAVSAKRQEIDALYAKHNPEKLGDAPKLIAKYGEDKLLTMVRKKYPKDIVLRKAEADAREDLKQEIKTMRPAALHQRAIELGVSPKDLEDAGKVDENDWHYKLKVLHLQKEYRRVVVERVVQGESLPPGWFQPERTRSHMKKLTAGFFKHQPVLRGHPVWGGPVQKPFLTEKYWLLSSLWHNLDERRVYVPIYFILVALAVLSPIVIFRAGSRTDTAVASTPQTLGLHALGTLFFWCGFVFMFHNLRAVVRLRTSWLHQVAQMMGVDDKQLESSHLREEIIDLIVGQYENRELWKETLEKLDVQEREKRAVTAVVTVQLVFRMKQKLKRLRAAKADPAQLAAPESPTRTPTKLLPATSLVSLVSTAAAPSSDKTEDTTLLPPDEFLKTVPVFKADDSPAKGGPVRKPVDWRALAELAAVKSYQKGDVIILQGTPAADLFILKSGAAESWKDDHMTMRFSPKDYFGERAWRRPSTKPTEPAEVIEYRGATVIAAVEATTCLAFPKEDAVFDRMEELVPFLDERLHSDKKKYVAKKKARVKMQEELYDSFETFTHISDRRARLVLDAMVRAVPYRLSRELQLHFNLNI